LYCDSGIMPIPRYDGREADFAWRGFTTNKGMKRISREMTLMNSTKRMRRSIDQLAQRRS